MKNIKYFVLLLLFFGACTKYEALILLKNPFIEKVTPEVWPNPCLYYNSDVDTAVNFNYNFNNVNGFNYFGTINSKFPASYYEALGAYQEQLEIKVKDNEVFLRKSESHGRVIQNFFDEFHVVYSPYEIKLYSNEMQSSSAWKDTIQMNITYYEYDVPYQFYMDTVYETVQVVLDYRFEERESLLGPTGKIYTDVIKLRVNFGFNSNFQSIEKYSDYYFNNKYGLIMFSSDENYYYID